MCKIAPTWIDRSLAGLGGISEVHAESAIGEARRLIRQGCLQTCLYQITDNAFITREMKSNKVCPPDSQTSDSNGARFN